MAKNKFNKAWLDQHINDPYVKQAVRQGYRSRAAFKLIEIDQQVLELRIGQVILLCLRPLRFCEIALRAGFHPCARGLDAGDARVVPVVPEFFHHAKRLVRAAALFRAEEQQLSPCEAVDDVDLALRDIGHEHRVAGGRKQSQRGQEQQASPPAHSDCTV